MSYASQNSLTEYSAADGGDEGSCGGWFPQFEGPPCLKDGGPKKFGSVNR